MTISGVGNDNQITVKSKLSNKHSDQQQMQKKKLKEMKKMSLTMNDFGLNNNCQFLSIILSSAVSSSVSVVTLLSMFH